MNSKYLTRAGIIAAIYVLLVFIQLPLGDLAFGPIQLRISEGLTLLPLVESAAIPGLFIGCLLSNILGRLGLVDIIGGSLVTLMSAYLTSKMPNKKLGAIPPVLLNGIIVSIWVSKFMGFEKYSYPLTVISISIGELLAIIIFGNLFLKVYERVKKHI